LCTQHCKEKGKIRGGGVRATDHKQGSSQWFFRFIGKSNGKGRVQPVTVHEDPEVE